MTLTNCYLCRVLEEKVRIWSWEMSSPAIVTDTHCIRLVNRMGLVDGIKEPAKVEKELWKIIPPEEGSDFCHRLVYHGREVCTARTHPYCEKCCISDICKKVGV